MGGGGSEFNHRALGGEGWGLGLERGVERRGGDGHKGKVVGGGDGHKENGCRGGGDGHKGKGEGGGALIWL